MSHKRLVLGDVDFTGTPGSPFSIYALGTDSGTDWGNPEPVEQELRSFLQDGAVVVTEGYGNRELFVAVETRRADSQSAADAEAALFLELGKRNTLTCYSDDGVAEPTVFDVITSSLQQLPNDLREHMQGDYNYLVRLVCEPWARSADEVTASLPAPSASPPTVTLIDACESTTGWSASGGTGPTVVSGSVKVENEGPVTLGLTLSLTRSALSVNMAASPYLRLEFVAGGTTSAFHVKINGAEVAPVGQDGSTRWYPFSGTLNSVQVIAVATTPTPGGYNLSVADISRSDTPNAGSVGGKTGSGVLEVAGSVRTAATLELDGAGTALGDVLVYTRSEGNAQLPPLRVLRVSGSAETTDATAVSGKYSLLSGGGLHSEVPAPNVPPDGYLLLARVWNEGATGDRTIAWAAKSRVSRLGWTDDDAPASGSVTKSLTTGEWTIVTLGTVTLPTRSIGDNGRIRVEITGPSDVRLDEAWLFGIGDGQLTWVNAPDGGVGGTITRLWLDAPRLDQPTYSIQVGDAADRSDAVGAGTLVQSFGAHQSVPPALHVFWVSTNTPSSVALSYPPRWHTRAAS